MKKNPVCLITRLPHFLGMSLMALTLAACKTEEPPKPNTTQTPQILYTSSYITGSAPNSIIAADINADGITDVVTSSYSRLKESTQSVSILLGNEDGTFQILSPYFFPSSVSELRVADINQDGHPDIIAASFAGQLAFLYGEGNAVFKEASVLEPWTTAPNNRNNSGLDLGHFNSDEFIDIVITSTSGMDVLLGDGKGAFNKLHLSNEPAKQVKVADINRDGISDLVTSTPDIYFGKGDGTFTLQPRPASTVTKGVTLKLTDVNNDGWIDIGFMQPSALEILTNNRDGSFTSSLFATGQKQGWGFDLFYIESFVFLDANCDEFPDMVFAGTPKGMNLVIGNGDSTFINGGDIPHNGKGRLWITESGDINNDGIDDIIGGIIQGDAEIPGVALYKNLTCAPKK